MSPFVIGNLQFTLSLIVYVMISYWYIHPVLKNKPWQGAVMPLLFVHAFRYGPMTLLMPGQVDIALPVGVKETIAYGDLIACGLALVAILGIRSNYKHARILVWAFSIVGVADVVTASVAGIGAGALDLYMGFNLYILNFYVPMLIVTHVMIISYLVRKY